MDSWYLSSDARDLIDEKRPKKYGGLKVLVGLLFLILLIWMIRINIFAFSTIEATSIGRSFLACSWLVFLGYGFHIGASFIVSSKFYGSIKRWPFNWFAEYIEMHVRGWSVVYIYCSAHQHRSMALLSPRNELMWIEPYPDHVLDLSNCCTHSLVLPLGGWKREPFVHLGNPTTLKWRSVKEVYFPPVYWRLKEASVGESPDSADTSATLIDVVGDSLHLPVWTLLRMMSECAKYSYASNTQWSPYITKMFVERQQAFESASLLFNDLQIAEQQIYETRRFMKSTQAMNVRVWLLDRLYHWVHELNVQGIRPVQKEEIQKHLDTAVEAHGRLREREAKEAKMQ